jgi:hypothetical protein
MTATHKGALQGDDRQIVSQTFKRGVASRPTNTVEENVGQPHGRDELMKGRIRQEHTVLGASQPDRRKRAIQPFLEQFVRRSPVRKLDEDELAVAHLAGDASKHVIILRQVLVERLTTPIDRC